MSEEMSLRTGPSGMKPDTRKFDWISLFRLFLFFSFFLNASIFQIFFKLLLLSAALFWMFWVFLLNPPLMRSAPLPVIIDAIYISSLRKPFINRTVMSFISASPDDSHNKTFVLFWHWNIPTSLLEPESAEQQCVGEYSRSVTWKML